jgi:phenylpyruvate tautomerase PptA (4-oxalocrotonate tautomerase family)
MNSDGSAATGVAGYNIYYATASPITTTNSSVLTVDDQTTSIAISSLATGTYYVAVSAVYDTGDESTQTDEVVAIVP